MFILESVSLAPNVRKRLILAIAAMIALTTPMVFAIRAQVTQASKSPTSPADPKFEVASIRQSTMGRNSPLDSLTFDMLRTAAHRSEHGRLWLPESPLSILIQLAYNVNPVQVFGAP